MPIQVPNSNGTFSDLKEIYVGRDSISQVYSGSDLVWAKDITQVTLPNSTNYNTSLRKNWLAYDQWRNETGKCYFQINGWAINEIQCQNKSVGNFSTSSGDGVSSNSTFETNYKSSNYFTHGGKDYTIIKDLSVINGYFPLTFTFQTYCLGSPSDNNINNLFFITTANSTSNGRLDKDQSIASNTPLTVNQPTNRIELDDVYLLPNDNSQRNFTIGQKNRSGTYRLANYEGRNPQNYDVRPLPWKQGNAMNSVGDANINSQSGRVIILANDSGLDASRGFRDNTTDYWEGTSNPDQFSFNTQISVTMMAKKDDWTDKDISFVQIYSRQGSGSRPSSELDFNDIKFMQKVNFCLLTESQYVDKVSSNKFTRIVRSNLQSYPQLSLPKTSDNSVRLRWEPAAPEPDTAGTTPSVSTPVVTETEDIVSTSDVRYITNKYTPVDDNSIQSVTISFLPDGFIELQGMAKKSILFSGNNANNRIIGGSTIVTVSNKFKWHEDAGTSAMTGTYEAKARLISGKRITMADNQYKKMTIGGSQAVYRLFSNEEVKTRLHIEIRNADTREIVATWNQTLELKLDPDNNNTSSNTNTTTESTIAEDNTQQETTQQGKWVLVPNPDRAYPDRVWVPDTKPS